MCPPSGGSCLLLFPSVSHCTPSCFPWLDGVSTFSMSYAFCVGWCVCLSEAFPPLSLSLSPSLSLFLFPFVGGGLILHFFIKSCTVRGSYSAFSCVGPCSSKHVLNLPTLWGLQWCNFGCEPLSLKKYSIPYLYRKHTTYLMISMASKSYFNPARKRRRWGELNSSNDSWMKLSFPGFHGFPEMGGFPNHPF